MIFILYLFNNNINNKFYIKNKQYIKFIIFVYIMNNSYFECKRCFTPFLI